MKTAFAYWDDRISPVFDISRQIYIVEVVSGRIVGEARETLPGDFPVQKVLRLTELGIDTVVCGAISRHLRELAEAYDIHVIPFVAGDLREIVQAWHSNGLQSEAFAMPGCCFLGRGLKNRSAAENDDQTKRDRQRLKEE